MQKENKMKQPNPEQIYLNEYGVNITKRIEQGKTLFFKERSEAKKIADEKRSYIFEIFDNKNLIGFGVSK